MNDDQKTHSQLIDELNELRRRIADLESREPRPGDAERLRWIDAVANHLTADLFLKDPEGRFLFVSPAVYKAKGLHSERDILGKSDFDFQPLELARHFQKQEREIFETGIPMLNREIAFVDNQGHSGWYLSNKIPVFDNDGKPEAIAGINFLITDLKLAHQLRLALASLGQKLSVATSPVEAARIIVSAADEFFRSDSCYLYSYSAADNIIHPILVMDIVDGARVEIPAAISGTPGPLIARVMREGGLLFLDDDKTAPAGTAPFGNTTRRSASRILVPIRKGGDVVGVLSFQSYSTNAYTQSDLVTLQTLADYCGGALDRIRAEEALAESEERHALAMRGANDGLWDWNLKTAEIYFSPRWEAILGATETESRLPSHPDEWFKRVHPADLDGLRKGLDAHLAGTVPHFECEHRLLHKDGTYRWALSRGLAIRDEKGTPTRIAGSLTDISARKAAEEQLVHSALYDALTSLPNRSLFLDRLSQTLDRQKRRHGGMFAVLFLDLDRFKVINDSLGHRVGDRLLVKTAHRLRTCVRPMDTVARLGGDEFIILVDDIHDAADAIRVAERIQRELARPFRVDGNDVFSGASIGISISGDGHQQPEDLIRDADTAMYQAKAAGKGRHQVFDPSMHTRAVALLKMETDLRHALDRKQFCLFYQPIFSIATRSILGFEALLRWRHPERGLLLPHDFLSLAEDTGLILPIGRWALREACRRTREWQQSLPSDPSHPPIGVSVNLSARQFAQKDIVAEVAKALAETGLAPECLSIEITESAVMENLDTTVAMLSSLKALGVHINIDDFGTGYSSLGYLHRFPIDALKIDPLFVRAMATSEEDSQIVHTIIGLARNLGMGIIAEGVESDDQLAELNRHSCPLAQGYLLSHPLPEDEIPRILESNPPR